MKFVKGILKVLGFFEGTDSEGTGTEVLKILGNLTVLRHQRVQKGYRSSKGFWEFLKVLGVSEGTKSLGGSGDFKVSSEL